MSWISSRGGPCPVDRYVSVLDTEIPLSNHTHLPYMTIRR